MTILNKLFAMQQLERAANKPFEWTGCLDVVSMALDVSLPLKGSVRPIQSDGAIDYVLNLTASYTLLPPTLPHCNPGF